MNGQKDWWVNEGKRTQERPGRWEGVLSFLIQHSYSLHCYHGQSQTDIKNFFNCDLCGALEVPPRYSWSQDRKILLYTDCLSQYIRFQKPWGTIYERTITLQLWPESGVFIFLKGTSVDLCWPLCKLDSLNIVRSLPVSMRSVFWVHVVALQLRITCPKELWTWAQSSWCGEDWP